MPRPRSGILAFALSWKTWLFLLAAVLVPLGYLQYRPSQPEIRCADSNPASGLNVLVVGESWAAGGRLFPELNTEIAHRETGPVHVCSMAFSGKNTGKIYRGVRHQMRTSLPALFGGRQPGIVLVLNGVNDQMQHVGAGRYADNTAQLARLFPSSKVMVVSAPTIRFNPDRLPALLKLKAELQKYVFDYGEDDPLARYRQALRELHPEIRVLPYDSFMPTFDKGRYQPDGIHLTPQSFHEYGSFLGKGLSSSIHH